MPDFDDYRLRGDAHRPLSPAPSGSKGPLLWTIVAVAAIALAVVLWFALRRGSAPPPPDAAAPQPVAETTAEVAAPKAAETLPSLEGSDAIVRGVVKGLSARPELVTWLATDNLVRNFVGTVANIAEGKSPKSFLSDFTPAESFRASGRGTRFRTDPRSFARYDRFAAAFASLDSVGVARAYQQLQPLCESAYRELGVEGAFRDALERAIGRLLETPDVPADAPLFWNYATYQYTDEHLESLPAAEKQLLRMGPRNVTIVKDKLEELAIAMRLVPKSPSGE